MRLLIILHFLLTCSHSTTGQEVITRVALENRQAGRDREEIKLDDLQESLTQTLYNSTTSKWGCHRIPSYFEGAI